MGGGLQIRQRRLRVRLARISGYTETVRENLRWAARDHRAIVRHLIMPGHVDCCWRPIAAWLAETLPEVEVSLREGFWPAWRSSRHPELQGPASSAELLRARRIAADHGLRLVT